MKYLVFLEHPRFGLIDLMLAGTISYNLMTQSYWVVAGAVVLLVGSAWMNSILYTVKLNSDNE